MPRENIKKIALSRPTDHDLPFSTWSLSKLAEFLVAEGVVDDISHEAPGSAGPGGVHSVSEYVCSLNPPEVRIGIVLDNFSPNVSTKKDQRVGDWAAANNVELAYTPTYSSWVNRIEAHVMRADVA